MKIAAVLLAAGEGTRMRSTINKVLHPLLGKPMVWYSLQAVNAVTPELPVVVVGNGAESVRAAVGDAARFVVQEERLGTGHAVMQAEDLLRDKADLVLVAYADMPLLTAETLQKLVAAQQANSGPVTMTTIIAEDPRGFGRVIRAADGSVQQIVEEVAASPEQLQIRELNVSPYCFDGAWLWDALRRIPLSAKGEYYLTDLVGLAVEDGLKVQAVAMDDPQEAIGINTRVHLAEAETALRGRVNRRWMLAGVSMVDPQATYIEPDVTIGQDTVIWPNTYLQGDTQVGPNCTLGPNTIIRDTRVGAGCMVFSSVLEHAQVEDDVDIGPFGHLRKGAHLAQGVHMGNFGEVKNSYLGPGVKMGHFSYLGDATLDENVNIGAGTITCNYDGEKKHPTKIGANAFIGSDTMLVAPVEIGAGAKTGAGSVVTKDVPPKTVAVGVPARPVRKLE
jgi:bifunctional UDP-N-acetylglucosamine pyrophosphorylase/glucosamine-1-phosphate N-acetyltransferase